MKPALLRPAAAGMSPNGSGLGPIPWHSTTSAAALLLLLLLLLQKVVTPTEAAVAPPRLFLPAAISLLQLLLKGGTTRKEISADAILFQGSRCSHTMTAQVKRKRMRGLLGHQLPPKRKVTCRVCMILPQEIPVQENSIQNCKVITLNL